MRIGWLIVIISSLTACTVGPNYSRPPIDNLPTHYKEAPRGWKQAHPRDTQQRGAWWTVFKDTHLNNLEEELTHANQNIAVAAAQYHQALALIDEARASYFPQLSMAATVARQRQVSGGTSFVSSSSNGQINSGTAVAASGSSATSTVFNTHSLSFNTLWEADLWGSIHRTVEANTAAAQAGAAQLAATKLSLQATLAQTYFQVHALDRDQYLLDKNVREYQKTLGLIQHRYAAGIAARSDVLQAQSQLEAAKAFAVNNHIARGQYEHAIAVLVGKPAANFSLPVMPLTIHVPRIPLGVPSELLERRPDVAQAERLMAQANAQIGIAIAAYFPTLNLSATASVQHQGFAHWFSVPALNWAVGPQLAETLLDGGLRKATTQAARENYTATVASYRQTVLTAFQEVEDNLISLRVLAEENNVQNRAAADALKALQLVLNQYKAGTAAYSDVLTAQTAAYTAEKNAADIAGQRMVAAAGLIKALGGGW